MTNRQIVEAEDILRTETVLALESFYREEDNDKVDLVAAWVDKTFKASGNKAEKVEQLLLQVTLQS